MLVVFGGLPGTGKTTLSRRLAQAMRAAFLRVDDIEQTLRESGALAGDVGPSGYMVGYALAAANLRLGQAVVADCVNPLAVTRAAWRDVAVACGTAIAEVEVVCSDPAEHRRRVEARAPDPPGLPPPRWDRVQRFAYEPWVAAGAPPPLRIDTAGRSVAQSLAELRAALGLPGDGTPGA